MSVQEPTTILLGSYGRGNVGDDVFLAAAAELFEGRKVYINSADDSLLPERAKGVVSTISTTGVHDVLKKLKVFLKVKHIIYFGGDVWVELYGDRFPRQSLYKMVALNALARLFGKKVYYVGTGIGRLTGLSLGLARLSARLSHTVIAREQRSAEVLGLANIDILPDLAVNLPYFQPRLHTMPATGKSFKIGISPLYYVPDPARNFPVLAAQLASFINGLPAERFSVSLLPMLMSRHDLHDDQWASEQIRQLVKRPDAVEIYQAENLEDMVRTLGSMDLVIGARLHANILAAFNATPCLGIAYRAKVGSFFSDNGLGQYCLDLNAIDRLPETFQGMYDDYGMVAQRFYDASKRNMSQKEAYRAFAATYE